MVLIQPPTCRHGHYLEAPILCHAYTRMINTTKPFNNLIQHNLQPFFLGLILPYSIITLPALILISKCLGLPWECNHWVIYPRRGILNRFSILNVHTLSELKLRRMTQFYYPRPKKRIYCVFRKRVVSRAKVMYPRERISKGCKSQCFGLNLRRPSQYLLLQILTI